MRITAAAGLTPFEVAQAMNGPQSCVMRCELVERNIDPIDLRKVYKKQSKVAVFRQMAG